MKILLLLCLGSTCGAGVILNPGDDGQYRLTMGGDLNAFGGDPYAFNGGNPTPDLWHLNAAGIAEWSTVPGDRPCGGNVLRLDTTGLRLDEGFNLYQRAGDQWPAGAGWVLSYYVKLEGDATVSLGPEGTTALTGADGWQFVWGDCEPGLMRLFVDLHGEDVTVWVDDIAVTRADQFRPPTGTVVPEPSAMLGAGALCALAAWRLRRQR